MANPQLEDGFLRIANKIWDHWAKIRVPGCAEQVLKVIIRKTYGFNKKSDRIALDQMSGDTGITKPHVLRAVKILTAMNLIATKGNKKGVTYWFNKDYDKWKPLPKKVTLPKKAMPVAKEGNASLPSKATIVAKLGTTKDTLKDTSTKDTSKDISSPGKSGDHQKAIDYFCSKYKQPPPIGIGIKYDFRKGKDGEHIKELLATFGLVHFCRIVDQIFLSNDSFYRTGGGITLGVLKANANKLAQEIVRQDSPLDQLSEKGRRTAANIAAVLKERGDL